MENNTINSFQKLRKLQEADQQQVPVQQQQQAPPQQNQQQAPATDAAMDPQQIADSVSKNLETILPKIFTDALKQSGLGQQQSNEKSSDNNQQQNTEKPNSNNSGGNTNQQQPQNNGGN